MPCVLEPIPTPPDAASDDPTGLLHRAAAYRDLIRTASDPLSGPEDERTALAEALAWTATQEARHPRWPAGTPGGLGGQFMRVGQLFDFGGKTYEVANIVEGPDGQGKVIAHLTGGKAAEERIFDPTKTSGPEQELTGATRPAPKPVKGGKGQDSTVTAVNPHVDPSTHNPKIKLPDNSELTAEEWAAFGEAEQLHYVDLMKRYGDYGKVSAATLIKKAYQEFDAEVANAVSGGYSSQYGSSSGQSLSLTNIFHGGGGAAAMAKREKALELQGLIRDAYAWDLYNRTRSPDLTIIHKSGYLSPAKPTSWWKSKFIKGKERIFSGLSCSFNSEAIGKPQVGIATAVSMRHVVMATYVAGPMKNAASSFAGEQEVAVPYQLLVDEDKALSYHINEVPSGYRQWLGKMTKVPRGGETFRMFLDAVNGNGSLPVPPVAAEVKMKGSAHLPPPPEAITALEEYADKLPKVQTSAKYTPAELKATGLPFDNLGSDGNPEALEAAESHAGAGDFVMGLGGTLYYVNADPASPSGLRLHKIVPDGNGGLTYNNEEFPFSEGHPNYKLLGKVPPTKVAEVDFKPEAWINSTEDPRAISTFKVGDKFKVNGTPYEVKAAPGPGVTEIQDINSGLTGTINSDYKAVPLVPNPEYGGEANALKAAKGMTLSYKGEKHVVTSVKKNGIVSIKAAKPGSKVVQLDPEDDALQGLFNPKDWKIGGQTAIGGLETGDHFHGGRGKRIRPYRVDDNDGTWVHWTNLDTGEEGKSLASKKVKVLDELDVDDTATVMPPPKPGATPATTKPGDTVDNQQLAVGDEYMHDGKLWHVTSVTEGESGEKMVGALPYYEDKSALNPSGSQPVPSTVVLTGKAQGNSPPPIVPKKVPTPADHVADSTPAVGDAFTAYKSSHGPGGKYKHERLGDLQVGTVLQDKTGKKWKIQVAGDEPIITDGIVNYKASGKLRGKVLEGESLPSVAPPHTADEPDPEGTAHLTPDQLDDLGYVNAGGQTLDDLPVGAFYLNGSEGWMRKTTPGTLTNVHTGEETIIAPPGSPGLAADYAPTGLIYEPGAEADTPTPTDPGPDIPAGVQTDEKWWPDDFIEAQGGQTFQTLPVGSVWPRSISGKYRIKVSDTELGEWDPDTKLATDVQAANPSYKPKAFKLPQTPEEMSPTVWVPEPDDTEPDDTELLLGDGTPEQKSYFAGLDNGDKIILDDDGPKLAATVIDNGIPGNGIKVKLDDDGIEMTVYAAEVVVPGTEGDPPGDDPFDVTAFAAWGGISPTMEQAANLLADNPGKTFGDLPIGTIYTMHKDGFVWLKVGDNSVMALGGGGVHEAPGSAVQPAEIAMPPSAAPTTLDGLQPLDTLPNGMKVVAQTSLGFVFKNPDNTVHKDADGKIASYPPDTPIEDVVPNEGAAYNYDPEPYDDVPMPETGPDVAPPGEALAELNPGDEFENDKGHPFQVVALTNAMEVVVKDMQSGNLAKYDEADSINEVVPIHLTEPPGFSDDILGAPDTLNAAMPPGLVAQAEQTAIDLALPGYASAWGTGGKYKHDWITDLQPGDKFLAKGTKANYIYVKSEAGGTVLIWSPNEGKGYRVPAAIRVRKVD